ncbi:UNVERIFIED_CONTAM: hypothetical protein Sradi_3047600 [Sesamum radiatum]|uniref:Uncharacterized protein n=1 Tax=Sesamum radiatum TaxID=300843 RepID=A0AAW2RBC5_SESRA
MSTDLLYLLTTAHSCLPSIRNTDVPVDDVQPMLVACARQLIEHISKSGSSKALVLSLGLRDHSTETLKGIVSAVIEKFAEITLTARHPYLK